ncbi:MAG: YceI family protein [Candidatus Melainabacteria bacterium]|nr:YceI family protein [Candidatus Melainabacteria bacterium]
MIWRTIFITFCVFIFCLEASANTLPLDEKKSKVTYTLTQFRFPFKRKALPTTGEISLSENSKELEGLKLKTKFISKNFLFKKFINFDLYPDFQFVSMLSKPIPIDGTKVIELSGNVLFHGVAKQVTIKLNNKSTDKKIIFVGYLNIEMSNFGLTPPRFIFFTVDDLIRNKVELFAERM